MHMQGSTCLEGGVYMFNYAGCHECKKKSFVDETEKHKEEEEDGNEESVSYKHVCRECGHVIAKHQYSFSVDEEYQEYTMECNLCGHGEATVSILPDDPREKQLF